MSRPPLPRRTCLLLLGVLPLAACVETAADFDPAGPPRARAPSGLPVALVSLEGAPEAVIQRLSVAMVAQAARRDISIVGIDGKPRYQLRGYLAAQPAEVEDGAARGELAWAFDLFDDAKRRAGRFSGQEHLRAGADWAAVTDSQVQAVAAKALDEVAAFLAAQPAAVAAGERIGARAARRG